MRAALLLVTLVLFVKPAFALIQVGLGNKPVNDHNWPAGALEVANLKARVGWWEGPPFGGGQWQFLYRGDTAGAQEAIDRFAKIRAPEVRIIVHEGPHKNQFLRDEKDPKADTSVDWAVTLWDPRSWNSLYNNPASTTFADDPSGHFRNPVDPPTLDLYVAGDAAKGIDFKRLSIPPNVKVTDERATAAGYVRDAAPVVRGDVYDLVTSKPIGNAQVVIEHLKGQNDFERVASAEANADGHFELTKAPTGSHRISIVADGYVPRSLGHVTLGANDLKEFRSVQLAPPVEMTGTVVDTAGKPIAGATVRADDVMAGDGRGYSLTKDSQATTDEKGRFTLGGIPAGHTQLRAVEKSYQMLDVLRLYATPAEDVALRMTATGVVTGKVLNGDGETHVSINPPGDPIGKWGGSMKVQSDGTFRFDGVPPGPYSVSANPMHGRGGIVDPKAKAIEVKAGETVAVEVAK